MSFSEKLVQLRKGRGWTQASAAQHINIQQSYLSKLENGHFFPSDDVILKLCDVYKIKHEELTGLKQKKSLDITVRINILLTMSFFLILAGQFSLFFSQTYYNYKTKPVDKNIAVPYVLSFHLTDQYLGDNYIGNSEGVAYTFELIAQRDIYRKENGWLTALGILIMLSTLSYILLKRLREGRKTTKES